MVSESQLAVASILELNFLPTHLRPFADIPLWAVIGVFASHFLGFFIRGALGFGSNMPIVLLTAWLLGPHHAILLVVLAAFVAQIHLFPQGLGSADWAVTRPLIIGMVAGIGLGTWLFTVLAADWLTLLLGLLVTAIVLMDHFKVLPRLGSLVDLRSRLITSSMAATSGFVGTISGGGGIYFLVGYLKLACPTPQTLRGTNLVVSGIFMFARFLFIALAGLVTTKLAIEAVLLLPVVFLGTWTGTRFFHTSSPARFYATLEVILLCAAVALMAKGITDVA
ncbi:MAG: TSUP family transporter [Acidiferrobacterales bacterium]